MVTTSSCVFRGAEANDEVWALLRSSMFQHLQTDVTDVVNGLVMCFGPEDFVGGVTSDRELGVPSSTRRRQEVGGDVNVDISAVWFVVDQQKLRPQKVDGVCRRSLSVEGYYLPDLETMLIESEYVGKVKVLKVMVFSLSMASLAVWKLTEFL